MLIFFLTNISGEYIKIAIIKKEKIIVLKGRFSVQNF